ncbi:MAG: ComF family protein [Acetobacter sp.]|nr:ComF family protein [Acetobacter sp.]
MIHWLKAFIYTILPPRCLLCGKVIHSDNSLCSDCFSNINFITKPYCKHCGFPLSEFETDSLYCLTCLSKKSPFRLSRSAVKYDNFSKKLILDFKFSDRLENKTLLAHWLFVAGEDIFNQGIDVIIPVPLHYARLFKRKYNQSAVLAAELSKLCHRPVDYKVLRKIKHTTPQIECSGKQRSRNVKNAFQIISPEKIKGKRIVLIDDVFTTGATLTECAKALKCAGAKSVDTLTVARVCSSG